jgi:AraC-like DNA-binding protein
VSWSRAGDPQHFHRHYRCTVAQYLRRLHVNAACDDIRRADLPLSKIALKNGFAD